MSGGFLETLLSVNLTSGQIIEEHPPKTLYEQFIGGYGVGARLLYDRLPPHTDPLGPDNILGFITGPLTSTPAPTATRFTVVAKSPLTQTWGDSNVSGFFGQTLKAAGFDGILFTGISPNPVYLFIDNGLAELREASELWGQDSYSVENWTKAKFGKNVEVVCIGPAGEKISLISGIVHAKGRMAARSGLGAVMGSKRLKAIVVRGNQPIPVANPVRVKELKRKYTHQINDGMGFANFYRTTGTPGYNVTGASNGDSPIRNWAGVYQRDFPEPKPIGIDAIVALGKVKRACWHCPMACWGELKTEFDGRPVEAHVPEYETTASFGGMLLNNNLPSIVLANEICNRHGLDSISTGTTVAFAFECFERGLITKSDTGGLVLTWGDARAVIALTEQIAQREGFGDVLADGVKRAAERIGKGSNAFAIHIGGQELAMHDPRFEPGLGLIYQMDATPGRHTQASQYLPPPGWEIGLPTFDLKTPEQKGRGQFMKPLSALNHIVNTSGLCLFGYLSMTVEFLPEWLSAVTGHPFTLEELLIAGERISTVRQAFNVREGFNAVTTRLPDRAYGRPPLTEGATAGIRVEIEELVREYLTAMDWSLDGAVPSQAKLIDLGLADIASDIHSKKGE
jgi:aldehyde:ferredoxin oxidoreductase